MDSARLSITKISREQKEKEYESTTTSYVSDSKQNTNALTVLCKSLETHEPITEHLRAISKNGEWTDKARVWAALVLSGPMPMKAISHQTGIDRRRARRAVGLLITEGWCRRDKGSVALFRVPRIAETAAERGAGNVYFIESADGCFIKIGFSRNVSRRINQLDTIQPKPFTVRPLGWMPGTLQTERFLHEQFAEDRAEGEWFRKSERLAQFLETLNLTKPGISVIERVA